MEIHPENPEFKILTERVLKSIRRSKPTSFFKINVGGITNISVLRSVWNLWNRDQVAFYNGKVVPISNVYIPYAFKILKEVREK